MATQLSQHALEGAAMCNFAGTAAQLKTLLELPFPVYFIVTGLCTVADDPVAEVCFVS